MSSPIVYSRCCTNSIECPKTGLLCMPEMNPSTTWRARRSSRLIRAMVCGCRKRRGSSEVVLLATVVSHCDLVGWVESSRPTTQHASSRQALQPDAYCPVGLEDSTHPTRLRREDLLEPIVPGQVAFL